MPCLPVDSAKSCSSHSPRPGSEGAITKVSLSRPERASAASAAPSHTAPGMPCAPGSSAAVSHARDAPCRRAAVSTPISVAGTIPNGDSAL